MWCGAIVWPPAAQCCKSNADHISSYINYLTVRHFQQCIVHKPYWINTTDFEFWFGSSTFEIMKKEGKIADQSQDNIETCPNVSFCEDLITGPYIFTFADIFYRSSICSISIGLGAGRVPQELHLHISFYLRGRGLAWLGVGNGLANFCRWQETAQGSIGSAFLKHRQPVM